MCANGNTPVNGERSRSVYTEGRTPDARAFAPALNCPRVKAVTIVAKWLHGNGAQKMHQCAAESRVTLIVPTLADRA
jgi:hypothetical protein